MQRSRVAFGVLPEHVARLEGGDALVIDLGATGQLVRASSAKQAVSKATVLTITFTQGGQLRIVDRATFEQASFLLRSIKGAGLDTVFIMVTAFGREHELERGREIGINAFLTKPVQQSLLFNTIMEVFGHPLRDGGDASHHGPRDPGASEGRGELRQQRLLQVRGDAERARRGDRACTQGLRFATERYVQFHRLEQH